MIPSPDLSGDPVSLRPFGEVDRPELDRWARRIGSEAYMARYLPHADRRFLWWVIQVAGRDVGTLWLESADPQTVVLGILLGDPGLFGQGIGSRAIGLALEHLSRVAPGSRVRLNVRASNQRAVACYRRCGFEVIASGTRNTLGDRYEFLTMERQMGRRDGSDA